MTDNPLVLVLGASGYVGGRLVPRLLEAGYRVRCLARSPAKLAAAEWAQRVEIVAGDLLDAHGLSAAFEGVDIVFHLVHSMSARPVRSAGSFADADRAIARNVAAAAGAAGARRVVYLGGLGEIGAETSPHLRSRAEVAEILLDGPVPVTVLRAAVIIGSGSASFEMLRHLVEKLPVMVTPRWVRTRVQPIAIRDVLRYLVGVLHDPGHDDHVFDIAGPDVLTYLDMMQGYADVAGLPRRLVVPVPVLTPQLSSHWVNLVTPVPFGLAKPLVLSLSTEVVKRPDGEDITELVAGECLPYRASLELALARVRDLDVETSWRDAEIAGRAPSEPYPGDPAWSGGTLLRDVRRAETAADPRFVFAAVTRIGGQAGWPTYRLLWQVRGLLDRLVGGIGLRRGRTHPTRLRVGDALDFWRVEAVQPPPDDGAVGELGLLRLRAEMRVPGQAWLEFRIEPRAPHGAVLTQRALFAPRGLSGRLYWYAMAPFHPPLFSSMVRALARRAEALARRGDDRSPTLPDAVTSSGGRTGPPAGLVEEGGGPDPGAPPARRAG